MQQRRQEETAAQVIGGRASQYIARRALAQTADARQRRDEESAATSVQAHQRRRMQQRQASKLRLQRESDERKKVAVGFATDKKMAAIHKAPTVSKGLVRQSEERQAAPPTAQRTGGGFTRRHDTSGRQAGAVKDRSR